MKKNSILISFLLFNMFHAMDRFSLKTNKEVKVKSLYNGPMAFEPRSRFNTLKFGRSEDNFFEFNRKLDDRLEKVYSAWFYDVATVSERVKLILFYMDQNCGFKEKPLSFQVLLPCLCNDIIMNRYKKEFAKHKSLTEKANNKILVKLFHGNEDVAGNVRSFMPIIPHPLFVSKPVRDTYFTVKETINRRFLQEETNSNQSKKRDCLLQ